ncbi:hypothetical protein PEKONANI_02852 [Aeromonas jandaei]
MINDNISAATNRELRAALFDYDFFDNGIELVESVLGRSESDRAVAHTKIFYRL